MTDEEDPLLNKFNEVLKFLESHSGEPLKGDVSPELEEKLSELESRMALFKKSFSEAPPINMTELIPKLSEREQRLISRWSALGMSALVMAQVLERANALFKEKKKGKVGINTKKSIQNRMNKFKNLGSNSKWKKL